MPLKPDLIVIITVYAKESNENEQRREHYEKMNS